MIINLHQIHFDLQENRSGGDHGPDYVTETRPYCGLAPCPLPDLFLTYG
jgi:hypothetical protein